MARRADAEDAPLARDRELLRPPVRRLHRVVVVERRRRSAAAAPAASRRRWRRTSRAAGARASRSCRWSAPPPALRVAATPAPTRRWPSERRGTAGGDAAALRPPVGRLARLGAGVACGRGDHGRIGRGADEARPRRRARRRSLGAAARGGAPGRRAGAGRARPERGGRSRPQGARSRRRRVCRRDPAADADRARALPGASSRARRQVHPLPPAVRPGGERPPVDARLDALARPEAAAPAAPARRSDRLLRRPVHGGRRPRDRDRGRQRPAHPPRRPAARHRAAGHPSTTATSTAASAARSGSGTTGSSNGRRSPTSCRSGSRWLPS